MLKIPNKKAMYAAVMKHSEEPLIYPCFVAGKKKKKSTAYHLPRHTVIVNDC